ncbi:MAG: AarF/ABC1/UbiB kinase family protein, partial [Anaerolineales bacterium]|nr:AarF/ABC1/UbiB kinase family protein [Anaerolineales bacterium]
MNDIEIKRRQPQRASHSLRSPRVRRAVQAALAHWPVQTPPPQPTHPQTLLEEMIEYEVPPPTAVNHASEVIAPLPRRKPFAVNPVTIHALKTMRLARPFKISYLLAFRRLFVWLYGLCYFLGNVWWDKLKRQDTTERRAIRLRQTFSNVGGTFIKFGQQMAIRVDLLPYAYCQELGKLLDRVDPFPTEQAIEAIERTTGQPLSDTFQTFDPDPIGSASVACVYQAILHNGDKVAVKVR